MAQVQRRSPRCVCLWQSALPWLSVSLYESHHAVLVEVLDCPSTKADDDAAVLAAAVQPLTAFGADDSAGAANSGIRTPPLALVDRLASLLDAIDSMIDVGLASCLERGTGPTLRPRDVGRAGEWRTHVCCAGGMALASDVAFLPVGRTPAASQGRGARCASASPTAGAWRHNGDAQEGADAASAERAASACHSGKGRRASEAARPVVRFHRPRGAMPGGSANTSQAFTEALVCHSGWSAGF